MVGLSARASNSYVINGEYGRYTRWLYSPFPFLNMSLLANVSSTESIIPFTYVVPITVAAGVGTRGSGIIQIDNSSDFVITQFSAVSSGSNPVHYYPNDFFLSIEDQGTSRKLSNGFVPQAIACGNAFQGYLESAPIRFEKNSTVNIELINNLAGAVTIYVAMHGYKVFGPK